MNVRRRLSIAGAILLTVAISAPLGALASHQFTDVPDSNLFHADIDALVDSGVTSGCGGGKYCPSANVTREQMAAFLNRLGALSPSKTPVVNADKLDGHDSSDFIVAGALTHTYGPSSWVRNGSGTNGTVEYYTNALLITGSSASVSLQLNPQTVSVEHGRLYLLHTVELCYEASATGYVNAVIVSGNDVATGSLAWTLTDNTDRTTAECRVYTVTPTFSDTFVSVYLSIVFTGSTQVYLNSTKVTWTELALQPVGSPASPAPGGSPLEGTSGAG